MKTLIITRHGKTVQGSPDISRKLTERGFKDIKLIASELQKYDLIPDLIISSPAIRALETANQVSEYFHDRNIPIITKDYMYPGYLNDIFDFIPGYFSPTKNIVMIVGHNPSLEILIKKLTDEEVKLSTSGTAVIDFSIEKWNEPSKTKGKLRKVFIPKELK